MPVENQFVFKTDVETLHKTLRDINYLFQKYEFLGLKKYSLLKQEQRGTIEYSLIRLVGESNMPKMAQKLIPLEVVLLGEMEWQIDDKPDKQGHYKTWFERFPIEIHTDATVRSLGEGRAEYVVVTHVKCDIPLIGGYISAFVEKDTFKNFNKEAQFLETYLASQQ